MTTVRELADKLGVSKSTLMRFCKDELGLQPEPRRVLQLDAVATAACCSRFGDCVTGDSDAFMPLTGGDDKSTTPTASRKLRHAAADDAVVTQFAAADDADDSVVTQQVAELMARVAGLEAELKAAREAADQQARQYRDEIERMTEAHDKERADNAAARAQLAGALESAEAKARRAEAEAGSYRPSLFGFYRKEEKPRLEG